MDLKELGGISLEEIEEFNSLTANEEREFLSWCNSVFNNTWFSNLRRHSLTHSLPHWGFI